MESLAHLVAESLVRHGFEATFDHRRLQWSQWFRCQDTFSFLLAPCKPGLFALGEEVMAPGELAVGEGKRMLALFQISEADDLGMALGRLFLPGSPERERLSTGRCFARYVVIEDAAQRRSAYVALQRWMTSSADFHVAPDAPVRGAERSFGTGSRIRARLQSCRKPSNIDLGFSRCLGVGRRFAAAESSNKQAQIGPPTPIPSGF